MTTTVADVRDAEALPHSREQRAANVAGVDVEHVVNVVDTFNGVGVVTAASHAITDPGDAHPVKLLPRDAV